MSPGQFETAKAKPDLLLRVIDGADIALLDTADLAPELGRFRHSLGKDGQRGRHPGARSTCPRSRHGHQAPDEDAPLRAIDHGHITRIFSSGDVGLVHPHEVGAIEISVRYPDLDAVLAALPGNASRATIGPRQHLTVLQRHLGYGGRPEKAEAVVQDEPDQSRHHQQGDGECPPGEPDEWFAARPQLLHR